MNNYVKEAVVFPGELCDVILPDISWRHQTTTAENAQPLHTSAVRLHHGKQQVAGLIILFSIFWSEETCCDSAEWKTNRDANVAWIIDNWLALAFFCCKDTHQHRRSNKMCLHFVFSNTKLNSVSFAHVHWRKSYMSDLLVCRTTPFMPFENLKLCQGNAVTSSSPPFQK